MDFLKDVSSPGQLLKNFPLPLNFEIPVVFACWPVAKTAGISKFSVRSLKTTTERKS